jgi:hypothetical protein
MQLQQITPAIFQIVIDLARPLVATSSLLVIQAVALARRRNIDLIASNQLNRLLYRFDRLAHRKALDGILPNLTLALKDSKHPY